VLTKDGNRTLVQCKNWKSRMVGVTTVRELSGVMTADGATGGIVVCSGEYINEAREFANGKPITLVDGTALSRLIGEVRKQPTSQHTRGPASFNPECLRFPHPPRSRVGRLTTSRASVETLATLMVVGQAFRGCQLEFKVNSRLFLDTGRLQAYKPTRCLRFSRLYSKSNSGE
jgi:Restriction endonuclease